MWSLAFPLLENSLTIAFLPISQEGRDDDLPFLPRAHAQQPLVHAFDQPTRADVGVVSASRTVAAENKAEIGWLEAREAGHTRAPFSWSQFPALRDYPQVLPAVKGSAIQQSAVVVIAHKVTVLHHSGAVGRA